MTTKSLQLEIQRTQRTQRTHKGQSTQSAHPANPSSPNNSLDYLSNAVGALSVHLEVGCLKPDSGAPGAQSTGGCPSLDGSPSSESRIVESDQ
jgi:hypothetical protein